MTGRTRGIPIIKNLAFSATRNLLLTWMINGPFISRKKAGFIGRTGTLRMANGAENGLV